MGTSALRSHLKINHLGPDPGSTCLELSLDESGAVHVHGTFCKFLEEEKGDEQFFLRLGSHWQSGALPGAAGQEHAGSLSWLC